METANVWHVSSFSLDVGLRPSLWNKLKLLTFALEERCKKGISNGFNRRVNGLSDKVALASTLRKALSSLSCKDTLSLSMVA